MSKLPCRAGDPDDWYADDEGTQSEAKAKCFRCPARLPCLRRALRSGEEFGVWGGLDPTERMEIVAGVAS